MSLVYFTDRDLGKRFAEYSRMVMFADSGIILRMTNPELVHKFLTERTPAPVCDDCIAAHADVSPRQQVNPIAASLGLTTDFDRARGTCFLCKSEKLVTRSLRYR